MSSQIRRPSVLPLRSDGPRVRSTTNFAALKRIGSLSEYAAIWQIAIVARGKFSLNNRLANSSLEGTLSRAFSKVKFLRASWGFQSREICGSWSDVPAIDLTSTVDRPQKYSTMSVD